MINWNLPNGEPYYRNYLVTERNFTQILDQFMFNENNSKPSLKTKTILIENVIFNEPATIVFWSDGTKTIVKSQEEPFDKEKGLAMAMIKKIYGNKGSYNEIFKEWCK